MNFREEKKTNDSDSGDELKLEYEDYACKEQKKNSHKNSYTKARQ